jgi:hypothetical protein
MDQDDDEPFLDTPGAGPSSAAGPSIAIPPLPNENDLAPPDENNPAPPNGDAAAAPAEVNDAPDPGSLEDDGIPLPNDDQPELEQQQNDSDDDLPDANDEADGDGNEVEGNEAEDDFHVESNVEDLDIACQFVDLLKKAEFGDEHDGLDEKTLERLRNPPTEEFVLDDPHLKLSIKNYLSTRKASQETYDSIRANIIECFPESKMLTFNQVKRKIAEITGVTPIKTDMCLNSCMAYTGPWKDLDSCPTCGETRYDPAQPGKRVPRQQFYTMPIGPQLQANWRSKEGARAMRYRQNRTQELVDMLQQNDFELESWDDVLCGRDYLEAVLDGTISDDDMVLMFSIDGAQLYRMKQSDTWIYIWIIVNYSPDRRYKKVSIRPGSFIPGPNKPGNADSFLFVGLHHLAALQKEGLQIWDALKCRKFLSKVFLLLKLADAPGMALISGLVGHVGRVGC